MSKNTIQEQFNSYLELINKIHTIGHDIDASINESEIKDLEERRATYKNRLQIISKNLVNSLSEMGNKYPIHNYLANQTTYLYVENGTLKFEYH